MLGNIPHKSMLSWNCIKAFFITELKLIVIKVFDALNYFNKIQSVLNPYNCLIKCYKKFKREKFENLENLET